MDLQNIYNRGNLPILPNLPSPNPPVAVASQPAIPLHQHPLFERGIANKPSDDLMIIALHLLFYDTEGDDVNRKSNLLAFSGFPPDADLTRKVNEIVEEKFWTTTQLRSTLKIFGLAVRGTREEMSTRLVRYLSHPYDVHKIGTVFVPPASGETASTEQAHTEPVQERNVKAKRSPPEQQPLQQQPMVTDKQGKQESIKQILNETHHLLQQVVIRTRDIIEDEQVLMTADEIQHCRMIVQNMTEMTNDLNNLLTAQELQQSRTAAMLYNEQSSDMNEV
jgi:hypothetical protein